MQATESSLPKEDEQAIVETAASGASLKENVVEASLISGVRSIQPGTPFKIGILLKMPPGWHIFWQHSGDLGMPTTIDWHAPEGFIIKPGLWPTPLVIQEDDQISYAYFNETPIAFEMTPPKTLIPGQTIALSVAISWLECKDLCRPGQTTLSVSLPISDSNPIPDTEGSFILEKIQNEGPQALPVDWFLAVHRVNPTDLVLKIKGSSHTPINKNIEKIYFYPFDDKITPSAHQSFERDGDGLVLHLKQNLSSTATGDRLSGLLYTSTQWIDSASVNTLIIDKEIISGPLPGSHTQSSEGHSLLVLMMLAFAGGLLLNLMPCIFPVLGIKILGFIHTAQEDPKKVRQHGLVFTLGVLVSFWILTGLLIALRASGDYLGWGFQLQYPEFVFALMAITFLFGLNLMGVFEINTRLLSVGGKTPENAGLLGSFFSGTLTTVLSTPCAAPFLAPALGAGLMLPPGSAFTVFTAIASGLASPYLLLSFFPSLLRWLPKPGAWMETFRHVMGFLLMATTGFLFWILIAQVSERKLLAVIGALVLMRAAAWAYGKGQILDNAPKSLRFNTAATLLLLLSLYAGFPRKDMSPLSWEPWTRERVTELLAQKRLVYVDFTARWCATCQTNKHAFDSPKVMKLFKELNIATLQGDWTNRDAHITAALAEFDRAAVPLDLLYIPGTEKPVILPNILMSHILVDTIEGVQRNKGGP